MNGGPAAEPEGPALVALDVDECWELLVGESIARLACVSDDGAPDVVPVNIVVRDGAVWFRSHDGELLRHVVEQAVSVQVDRFDWSHHAGWSVLVHGIATLLDPARLDDDELQPWAPGDAPFLVCVVPTRMTGRRIDLRQLPYEAGGYM